MDTYTITGADLIQYDDCTDVRHVIETVDDECCEELTRLLVAGEAELVPGRLAGWGREQTLRTEDGTYYHVDVE